LRRENLPQPERCSKSRFVPFVALNLSLARRRARKSNQAGARARQA
jgi:hypothetical protein